MKAIKEFFKRNEATFVHGGYSVFMYAGEETPNDAFADEVEYMVTYCLLSKVMAVNARTLVHEPGGGHHYDEQLWEAEIPAGTSAYKFLVAKFVERFGSRLEIEAEPV